MDQLFMDMIKDKKRVIESLVSAAELADKMERGFAGAKESVLVNSSEENTRKMLNTTMKCTKSLAEMVKMLVMLNLVYVSGDNYTADVAKILLRLGRGKEALQEMFKQKMQE